ELERHRHVELLVQRCPHRAHPPLRQGALEPVLPGDELSRFELAHDLPGFSLDRIRMCGRRQDPSMNFFLDDPLAAGCDLSSPEDEAEMTPPRAPRSCGCDRSPCALRTASSSRFSPRRSPSPPPERLPRPSRHPPTTKSMRARPRPSPPVRIRRASSL